MADRRLRPARVVALAVVVVWTPSLPGNPPLAPRPGEFPAIRTADAPQMERATPDRRAGSNILAALPLGFEDNAGQAPGGVDAIVRGAGYSIGLSRTGVTMRLHRSDEAARTLQFTFAGARTNPHVVFENELPGTSNYLLGPDPARWRTGVKRYARVRYEEIYSGIDVVFYGSGGQVEYDFDVASGADPRTVKLAVSGADDVRMDADGDLVLRVGEREIRQRRPVVYQTRAGERVPIEGAYALRGDEVHFTVDAYDRSKPLVIDPVIVYSTYLGGTGWESPLGLASDKTGAVYVLGTSESLDFPVADALHPEKSAASFDTVLSKINAEGTALEYSTYLPGRPAALAVGEGGEPFVVREASDDNPPAATGYRFGCTCQGISVAKLTPSADAYQYDARIGAPIRIVFSTGFEAAVDRTGAVVVAASLRTDDLTGSSAFPLVNAAQPVARGWDEVVVFKLTPDGMALVYSTFWGGGGHDTAYGLALGEDGDAVVVGETSSLAFPLHNAIQKSLKGHDDAFLLKLTASGAVVFSTYLGGSRGDVAYSVAVDRSGFIHVTGGTFSTDFPVVNAQTASLGADGEAAFVAKLTGNGGAILYSTYLGGSGYEWGEDIVVDQTGSAVVVGSTNSPDFPVRFPLQKLKGNYDVFVTRFGPSGRRLQSTFLGGGAGGPGESTSVASVAIGRAGTVFVTGQTSAADFPVRNAIQPSLNPGPYGTDMFVARVKMGIAVPDLDGDDAVDLILQNQADGRIEAWAMDGITRRAIAPLTPSMEADTGWKIVGTGDFDGDAYLDLAWQHGDGRVAVWFMTGTAARAVMPLNPPLVADLQWRIRAVADLNHDGRADLIWRHLGDGRVSVWFMDAARMLSGELLTPGQVPDLGWDIVGAGDFNGDDEWDLAWQHADGRIAAWLMRGTRLVDGTLISPPQVADTTWRIRGTGDINRDGHTDLLWQNLSDQRLSVWLMNGIKLVDGTLLTPSQLPDATWHLAGPR